MKLFWLLVDGLSFELYQRLRPALKVDIADAVPLEPLSPNCQTPPSLFSIWSGLPANRHGLTGYDMPVEGGGDPLVTQDSFACWPRDVEMVWDRWAARGGLVRTCAVPFVQPQRLGEALLSHTDVYRSPGRPVEVLAAGDCLRIDALDVSWRIGSDAHGMQVQAGAGRSTHVPFDTTVHLPLSAHLPAEVAGDTNRALAVHATHINGRPSLCFLGFHAVSVQGSDAPARRAAMPTRAYAAANPARLYAQGRLGRRLDEAGDGAAERLLLALLDVQHQSFLDDIVWAVCAGGAGLTLGYYPVIDLVSHHLLRCLAPGAADESPAQASFTRLLLEQLAVWLTQLLNTCRAALPPGCRFVAHSDHGMLPIRHDVNPNPCFAAAGWLGTDTQGRIDPSRSLVFYHPAENGWLALHPARLAAAGLAPADIVKALNRALADRLGGAFDLLPGPRACPAEGWESTWYLQPPAGVRLRSAMDEPLCSVSKKGGDHTAWCDDPWLKGVLLEVGSSKAEPAWAQPLQLMDLAPHLLDHLTA